MPKASYHYPLIFKENGMQSNRLAYREALKTGEHDPYRYVNACLGMWAWLAQRISALAVIVFLSLHVVLSYRPLIQFLLLLAVTFHAALGLRVILLDFNIVNVRYQKALAYGLVALGLLVMGIVYFSIY